MPLYLQQKVVSQYPLDGFEQVRVQRQRVSEHFLLTTQKHADTIVFLQMFKHLHRPNNSPSTTTP